MRKKLPPEIPPRDPTAKVNPRGRGIGADTRNKLDEQAIARQKLEELNESRRIEKEKEVHRNEPCFSAASNAPSSPRSERNAVSPRCPSDAYKYVRNIV